MIVLLAGLFYLLFIGLICLLLYWIIRLAVRHGLRDVEKSRQRTGVRTGPTEPH